MQISFKMDCVAVVFQGQRGPKGLPVSVMFDISPEIMVC